MPGQRANPGAIMVSRPNEAQRIFDSPESSGI